MHNDKHNAYIQELDTTTANKLFERKGLLLDHFAKRWSNEYLTGVREYHRASGKHNGQVNIGDVVQLGSESPRLLWRLGTIEDVIKGGDGLIRAAKVRTSRGLVTTRPIAEKTQRITITCPSNTRGRFVRIRRRDTLALVICEIEIYGNPINSFLVSGVSGSYTAYACGNIGYGYLGPVIGTSVAGSRIKCTINCITNTRCSAVEYDKKTNVCTLNGKCMNETQSSLVQDINKEFGYLLVYTSLTEDKLKSLKIQLAEHM
ncbi:unnamed protein product [Mytilus coruscus]|uniref:DUF5641 domain-containing protein n=1 Tax=Mytilus coruscus TaxID=42192 RepID=A0A6J8BZ80_MYTCO|nr:unnamed protein product [Mytilus coruscus]